MIARLWRTGVQPGREPEYERFATERSLPMFREQAGCLGVLLLRTPEGRAVLSLWADDGAVAALGVSSAYRETVRRLEATGVLAGAQTVEVFEVHGGLLDGVRGGDR